MPTPDFDFLLHFAEQQAETKEALKVNDGFQGTVDGVDLIDIVQFNALSRATATLKVTTEEQEGMIFFRRLSRFLYW